MSMTIQELREIRSRCESATPAPWSLVEKGNTVRSWAIDGVAHGMKHNKADAEFVSHARTDIPRLIDEIKRLNTKLKRLERNGAVDVVRCYECRFSGFQAPLTVCEKFNDTKPCGSYGYCNFGERKEVKD